MPDDYLQVPIANSYWVIPGQLLAGEYPITHDVGVSTSRLTRFLDLGVNCFIDLTRIMEANPYLDLLHDLAAGRHLQVKVHRCSIPDFSIPSIEGMNFILDKIDASLNKKMIVYVHCLGGIGRTGTVVGCHLVRHGMPGVEALERIQALRRDTPDWWYTSPESNPQREMILNWKSSDTGKP